MGQSTDAILVYGVDLGERGEVELPWDDYSDFDDWYVAISGGIDKSKLDTWWEEYEVWEKTQIRDPRIGWSSTFLDQFDAITPGFKEARSLSHKTQRAIMETCPIEIVKHCSCDYPMTIIAVPGTEICASRGSSEKIQLSQLGYDLDSAKVQEAWDFCQAWDIPYEDPSWILASMWC